MTALRLATWNVLHRVHAENFDEGVVAPHPDEAARVASIAALAQEALTDKGPTDPPAEMTP